MIFGVQSGIKLASIASYRLDKLTVLTSRTTYYGGCYGVVELEAFRG